MARNDDVTLVANIWTQLTNANAAAIRVANAGVSSVLLKATSGVAAPTNTTGSIVLNSGETLAADLTLAQLWPGVAGANRLWALSGTNSTVSVSHADA